MAHLKKYVVNWYWVSETQTYEGTSVIEAKDEDDARDKFSIMKPLCRIISVELQ